MERSSYHFLHSPPCRNPVTFTNFSPCMKSSMGGRYRHAILLLAKYHLFYVVFARTVGREEHVGGRRARTRNVKYFTTFRANGYKRHLLNALIQRCGLNTTLPLLIRSIPTWKSRKTTFALSSMGPLLKLLLEVYSFIRMMSKVCSVSAPCSSQETRCFWFRACRELSEQSTRSCHQDAS
jgi:hypothetical protein